MKNDPFSFEMDKLEEDDRRLLLSAGFVFLILTLIISHLFTRNLLWKMLGTDSKEELLTKAREEKVYNVLVEQDFKDKTIKDEIKALSDENAAGSGGITQKEGFHTMSPFYEFVMGSRPSSAQKESKDASKNKEEDVYDVGIFKADPLFKPKPVQASTSASNPSSGQETKIPSNYRFQQDFLFRWDGSKALSIPRKQLAGYHYFKAMLRKIESNFYPPGGGNFAYRDPAGYVIREGILPGEVKVMFMLNDAGDVIDIRLSASPGQKIVDKACLDSIRGQNFGVVPPEVKQNGMIFGINFIFPDFSNYR
ncbi:MAG: energy transducer TonB [Leptospiraceae bacterium]|nr:energy transducer TonB [Leptospiraceae bacterium]